MQFTLEKWSEDFIGSVAHHANNPAIAANLRNAFPHPYTYADAEGYVRFCMNADEDRQCTRAIVVDGEAVGSIGIFLKDDVYCKSAELGYWLGESFWGKGIMSEAVKQLCAQGFECYDLVRIFAEPYAHNTGSRRVLEKAGFALEGILKKSVYKNGTIFDSCMYGLIR